MNLLFVRFDAHEQRFDLLDFASGDAVSAGGEVADVAVQFAAEPECFAQVAHLPRHHRVEQNRHLTQQFGRSVQNGVQFVKFSLFCQRPRRGLFQIAVAGPHRVEHGGDAGVEPHLADGRGGGGNRVVQRGKKFVFLHGHFSGRGDHAAGAGGHFDYPAEQVAEVIGQIAVVAGDEGVLGEAGVVAHGHFGEQEVAEGVHAVLVHHIHRVYGVAARFAHLVASGEPPAVGEDGLGHFDVHGAEHGRPVDGVGGKNVLADQVIGGRPPLLERFVVLPVADAGDVVDQRVEPDVADVVAVERKFDSPVKPRLRA